LTIAANPDAMRQVFMRVDPGTTAITAGVCTVTYAANDGTAAQVDVLSLVTALSTILSTNLSKGALTVASAVVSGLVGGTSPKIQLGTTAVLAVPLPPGSVDVTILKEITDGADTSATIGTLTNAGIWTPHTVPNATHTFGVSYSTLAP
jgi:methyl coenzyme M reductase subunit C